MTKFTTAVYIALISISAYGFAEDATRPPRQSPADARVAFMKSLSLVDRTRYVDALAEAKQAVNLDPSNLKAWKCRIWLSLAVKDYSDALKSLEWLATRMPKRAATPQAERVCIEFSSFMGQCFGYLAGPADDAVSGQQRVFAEQIVQQQLFGHREIAFKTARHDVVSHFSNQMAAIQSARQVAQKNEASFRREQLARLAEENRYAHSELDKLEDTRLNQREIAANERNIIAITREESAGRTFASARTSFRTLDVRHPIHHSESASAPMHDHHYQRGRRISHHSTLASGYDIDRGLDNWHYLNVTHREAEQDERLDDRERDMHRRLDRIAKDMRKQLSRPIAGVTASVRAQTSKARALYTYIDFPVHVKTELASLQVIAR